MRLASAAVSPCDVISEWQTMLNNHFALTSMRNRPCFKGLQLAEHPHNFRVLRYWFSHRIPLSVPRLSVTRARAEPGERRVPPPTNPKHRAKQAATCGIWTNSAEESCPRNRMEQRAVGQSIRVTAASSLLWLECAGCAVSSSRSKTVRCGEVLAMRHVGDNFRQLFCHDAQLCVRLLRSPFKKLKGRVRVDTVGEHQNALDCSMTARFSANSVTAAVIAACCA